MFAVINVFSGVTLGGFKDSVMWVMAAYIIFYVIIMLVMEAHKCSKCSGSGGLASLSLSVSNQKYYHQCGYCWCCCQHCSCCCLQCWVLCDCCLCGCCVFRRCG